jgi:hypothetical protein
MEEESLPIKVTEKIGLNTRSISATDSEIILEYTDTVAHKTTVHTIITIDTATYSVTGFFYFGLHNDAKINLTG